MYLSLLEDYTLPLSPPELIESSETGSSKIIDKEHEEHKAGIAKQDKCGLAILIFP
jgi:hypothetical protein